MMVKIGARARVSHFDAVSFPGIWTLRHEQMCHELRRVCVEAGAVLIFPSVVFSEGLMEAHDATELIAHALAVAGS